MLAEKLHEYLPWWVVKTKPHQEFKAEEALKRQGFNTYCPAIKKEIKQRCQFAIKEQPLFSGYIFIIANDDAKKNIHLIRSTRGVMSILKTGESIISVSPEIIKALKIQESQYLHSVESYFKPEANVIINQGIYKDTEAIYKMDKGSDRSIVLITLIQKQSLLCVKKHSLIKN